MIGIYKITSPSNRIYIGQSLNIEYRWKKYNNLNCKVQPKLYRSLKLYSSENHKFEIIEEIDKDLLDEREIYWKQHYLNKINNNWKQVLFCQLQDGKGGSKSIITKNRISKALKGKSKPLDFGKNHSIKMKGRKINDPFILGNMIKAKRSIKNRKPIICLTDFHKFDSICDAAFYYNINTRTIEYHLKNNTKEIKTHNIKFKILNIDGHIK